MFEERHQDTKSKFTLGDFDAFILAGLVLTTGSALLGTFCKMLDCPHSDLVSLRVAITRVAFPQAVQQWTAHRAYRIDMLPQPWYPDLYGHCLRCSRIRKQYEGKKRTTLTTEFTQSE